ncbi:MAG TPA: 2,3-diphosphoglycerate-dependent phosphoglycerate mutase [Bacilli bacterium]|nr:2,3-diphosphoglycerate-dependent phosphoglycerate mutase [Bacilli bacterium]
MYLVLLRHGESVWNKENKFTGWTDVDLSEKGIEEAKEAGILLKNNNFNFDIAFTSVLKRSKDTLYYVLDELNARNIPVEYSWKLNERHYGALQGLNKEETKEKYGEKKVQEWRRSFLVHPPTLSITDERYPGNDVLYKDLSKEELPLTESLYDTMQRVIDYYENKIKFKLLENKNVLIVAHGNSLRALIKYLESISDDEIMNIEIPTGKPYIYEFDANLIIKKKYYL